MGNQCCGEKIKKDIVLLLLGLDNAGKTVAVKNLAGEPIQDYIPTIGFSIVNLVYKAFDIKVFDLGGRSDIRAIWERYFVDAHGIIFVVDSTDLERLNEARETLAYVLAHDKIRGKPILILANKQDNELALDEIDLVDKLDIETLVNAYECPALIESCAANENVTSVVSNSSTNIRKRCKKNLDKGIKRGYQWLVSYIVREYSQLNKRVENDVQCQENLDRIERAAKIQRLLQLRLKEEEERLRNSESHKCSQTPATISQECITKSIDSDNHSLIDIQVDRKCDKIHTPKHLSSNRSFNEHSDNESTVSDMYVYSEIVRKEFTARPKSATDSIRKQLELDIKKLRNFPTSKGSANLTLKSPLRKTSNKTVPINLYEPKQKRIANRTTQSAKERSRRERRPSIDTWTTKSFVMEPFEGVKSANISSCDKHQLQTTVNAGGDASGFILPNSALEDNDGVIKANSERLPLSIFTIDTYSNTTTADVNIRPGSGKNPFIRMNQQVKIQDDISVRQRLLSGKTSLSPQEQKLFSIDAPNGSDSSSMAVNDISKRSLTSEDIKDKNNIRYIAEDIGASFPLVESIPKRTKSRKFSSLSDEAVSNQMERSIMTLESDETNVIKQSRIHHSANDSLHHNLTHNEDNTSVAEIMMSKRDTMNVERNISNADDIIVMNDELESKDAVKVATDNIESSLTYQNRSIFDSKSTAAGGIRFTHDTPVKNTSKLKSTDEESNTNNLTTPEALKISSSNSSKKSYNYTHQRKANADKTELEAIVNNLRQYPVRLVAETPLPTTNIEKTSPTGDHYITTAKSRPERLKQYPLSADSLSDLKNITISPSIRSVTSAAGDASSATFSVARKQYDSDRQHFIGLNVSGTKKLNPLPPVNGMVKNSQINRSYVERRNSNQNF